MGLKAVVELQAPPTVRRRPPGGGPRQLVAIQGCFMFWETG